MEQNREEKDNESVLFKAMSVNNNRLRSYPRLEQNKET
jgi:hypothetical protein